MVIVPILALHRSIDNSILLGVRPEGKALAGYYEFPGGKAEIGETASETLQREIKEELDLDIDISSLKAVCFIDFRFEHKEYVLLMYYCSHWHGDPRGKEGQHIEFVPLEKLDQFKMPKNNVLLIPKLRQFISQHIS